MRNLSESLTFTVPLSSSAHHLAEQFCRQQSNQKKAKQVYLNTLAVSAVISICVAWALRLIGKAVRVVTQ
jgi:hypothetical protein